MVKREPIFAITELFGSWHFRKFRFCLNEELTNNFTAPLLYFEVESSNNYKTLKTEEQLETNLRQRGIGNTNQRKMGLCIKELDRIYRIREGSAGKVSKNLEGNNFIPKTEDELLKSLGLGVDKRTIQNYKKLTEMIPELEELVDTGNIKTYK